MALPGAQLPLRFAVGYCPIQGAKRLPLTAGAVFAFVVNMSKTFGQRIEELREAKDFSMRELASKCGISAPFVSDIESGFRYPSDDVLEQLAKALGTTVEDLKSYDPRPPSKEMQELVDADPRYGFAFRRMVTAVKELNITPDQIDRMFPQPVSRDPKS
jgi:transcriptional regulator with XRE-family HTH domain